MSALAVAESLYYYCQIRLLRISSTCADFKVDSPYCICSIILYYIIYIYIYVLNSTTERHWLYIWMSTQFHVHNYHITLIYILSTDTTLRNHYACFLYMASRLIIGGNLKSISYQIIYVGPPARTKLSHIANLYLLLMQQEKDSKLHKAIF